MGLFGLKSPCFTANRGSFLCLKSSSFTTKRGQNCYKSPRKKLWFFNSQNYDGYPHLMALTLLGPIDLSFGKLDNIQSFGMHTNQTSKTIHTKVTPMGQHDRSQK